ncbi:hypothetical protein LCGC14_2467820 [marine sediment metagenome]|uniref:N-acetyltransferase domain-containing protein n=1 Tax=marine sediment metagenome TaxID=412755 RepID=A0A0F9BC02_9ZZZZ
MGFDFRFRCVENRKDRNKLAKFLEAQSLSYPNYGDWVEKAIVDLDKGYKNSIIALSNGILVGDCVFQPHKQFPRIREVKNMRVHPKLRGRYFGVFMLKQAEAENYGEYDAIIADIRSNQPEIIGMARFCGYTELARIPLYEPHLEEVVMIRTFERTPTGMFEPVKKSLLASAA